MPLTIKIEGRSHKIILVCDHCEKPIDAAEEGNYEWDTNAAEEGASIFFTHKECCHAFERDRPDAAWGAMELMLLPLFLTNNLRVKAEKARRQAGLLSEI